ncbi:MAG: hypothetical protein V7K92_00810 [Nostoc sp.]|uniref:hypothetical protein n=1 Tax=Nostoc sp. TaxID=1180 RepID=UPI002FEFDC95
MTAVTSPYSPSLTGRLAANGHPTAGTSLSQCENLGEGRTASFMPLNPSTAVAPHERLHQAKGIKNPY